MLSDDSAHVRELAVRALGVNRDRGSAEVLKVLSAALKDPHGDVRQMAAWSLGLLRSSTANRSLGGALSDPIGAVRAVAAWALGLTDYPSAVPLLAAALKTDPQPGSRRTIAWSLGRIGDRRAVEPLIAALRDGSRGVREVAAWSLAFSAIAPPTLPCRASWTTKMKTRASVRRHAGPWD